MTVSHRASLLDAPQEMFSPNPSYVEPELCGPSDTMQSPDSLLVQSVCKPGFSGRHVTFVWLWVWLVCQNRSSWQRLTLGRSLPSPFALAANFERWFWVYFGSLTSPYLDKTSLFSLIEILSLYLTQKETRHIKPSFGRRVLVSCLHYIGAKLG